MTKSENVAKMDYFFISGNNGGPLQPLTQKVNY